MDIRFLLVGLVFLVPISFCRRDLLETRVSHLRLYKNQNCSPCLLSRDT